VLRRDEASACSRDSRQEEEVACSSDSKREEATTCSDERRRRCARATPGETKRRHAQTSRERRWHVGDAERGKLPDVQRSGVFPRGNLVWDGSDIPTNCLPNRPNMYPMETFQVGCRHWESTRFPAGKWGAKQALRLVWEPHFSMGFLFSQEKMN
jgi:hypothetical protein